MVEGETEDFMKQKVIFSCCASICKSFYTLYGAMTACIMLTFQEPIHEVVNIKRNYQGGYPIIWRPLEHWQLAGTSPQQHQNLHLLVNSALSAVQCPPSVSSRAWELRTLKTSASSNLGILALEGCMSPQTRGVCYT